MAVGTGGGGGVQLPLPIILPTQRNQECENNDI